MIETRHCIYHHGDVSARSAEQVDATAAITGPGSPLYACLECIRSLGLVPIKRSAPGVHPSVTSARAEPLRRQPGTQQVRSSTLSGAHGVERLIVTSLGVLSEAERGDHCG